MYVLNSGSMSLWSPAPKGGKGKGSSTVYTAWDNNIIPTLTTAQKVKYAPRVTFVDGLPEQSTVLDPAVVAKVAGMEGGNAVAFVAKIDSQETLQDIAKADTRKSTLAAVTKRLGELKE